jgi:hypothetical protein
MDVVDTHLDAPKAVILAGLLGSLLSLSFVDNMGKRQRFTAVVAGMTLAHYLAPFISHVFSEDKFEETIGFLVGLFGMSITASIFRSIQNSNLWGFVMSRWGGGNPQPPGGEQ